MDRSSVDLRRMALVFAAGTASVVATTVVVGLLEDRANVPDASSAYLLAVVGMAVAFGSVAAGATAIASIVIYDVFFLDPLHTLAVADPGEWLDLLLLLVVAIVVGRLAGNQRDRAEAALAREREARALFRVSRALASEETSPAIATILDTIRDEARMLRAWVTIAEGTARARVLADTSPDGPPPSTPTVSILHRTPGDQPARWVRIHDPRGAAQTGSMSPAGPLYRVLIEAGGRSLGSIWAVRERSLGDPGREETRVLAAAADQLGRAFERDRLMEEATSVEVARRSEALKSALLDSVSHDLRTPLSSIRATAGSLMDPSVAADDDERREMAAAIDREAQRLDRLVTNLLDMSRIEAGGVSPRSDAFVLADLVRDVMARLRPLLAGREVTLDLPEDLPPVLVDEVLMDQVITNLVENAVRHAGSDAPIRVRSAVRGIGTVLLTVEDGGQGVPDAELTRLFDKFYRVPRRSEPSRPGTGIGLSVVSGLVEAMSGRVTARRSELGGLAIDIELLSLPMPSDVSAEAVTTTPAGQR